MTSLSQKGLYYKKQTPLYEIKQCNIRLFKRSCITLSSTTDSHTTMKRTPPLKSSPGMHVNDNQRAASGPLE